MVRSLGIVPHQIVDQFLIEQIQVIPQLITSVDKLVLDGAVESFNYPVNLG